jgi:hypothetical protein
MEGDELEQVRRVALALPGVTERVSHGEPCFFVQDKRPLCYFHDNHRGDGRISLWCPAPPGVPADLTASEPDRFFRPTSASGVFANWLGVYLDTGGEDRVDWDEIAGIVEDAFRAVAPKTLITNSTTADGRGSSSVPTDNRSRFRWRDEEAGYPERVHDACDPSQGAARRRPRARPPAGVQGWLAALDPARVTCVRPAGQGPMCADGSGPQALVKVERPERSEGVGP